MAAFAFRCPSCQGELKSPEKLIGVELRCPKCASMIEVPNPHAAVAAGELESGTPSQQHDSVSAGALEGKESPVDLSQGRHREETEMDMTPMVDVTFLLLIFFMVTAAFSLQKAINTPVPKENEASTNPVQDMEEDPEFVTIIVDEYNTFRLITADAEEDAPSKQELIIKLRDARNNSTVPLTGALVKANSQAMHQKVVEALDAARAVGIERLKLLTVEGDEME